jgi:prolyl-tRNA editing enzyme YbaK/EbsC (Cys-tRNA(Pro) deacylase)
MFDLLHPAIQRVVQAASRKGVSLDVRPVQGSVRTAEKIAQALEVEVGQVVTPVLLVASRPDGRLARIVCLVSGTNQVDLALLASVSGEVGVRRAYPSELARLGGSDILPFGYGRDVPVYMDRDMCKCEWLWIALAANTAVLRVAPGTLRMLANAVVAPIIESSPTFAPRVNWLDHMASVQSAA